MSAECLIPDDVNQTLFNGTMSHKDTVGTFLMNTSALENNMNRICNVAGIVLKIINQNNKSVDYGTLDMILSALQIGVETSWENQFIAEQIISIDDDKDRIIRVLMQIKSPSL
jgi:hypothetical protein